jgi:hypothetical protein
LSWSDEFDDPIPGMRTLQDAADHILKLPKAQQQLPHWHRRRDADQGGGGSPGWMMFARMAMLQR